MCLNSLSCVSSESPAGCFFSFAALPVRLSVRSYCVAASCGGIALLKISLCREGKREGREEERKRVGKENERTLEKESKGFFLFLTVANSAEGELLISSFIM